MVCHALVLKTGEGIERKVSRRATDDSLGTRIYHRQPCIVSVSSGSDTTLQDDSFNFFENGELKFSIPMSVSVEFLSIYGRDQILAKILAEIPHFVKLYQESLPNAVEE